MQNCLVTGCGWFYLVPLLLLFLHLKSFKSNTLCANHKKLKTATNDITNKDIIEPEQVWCLLCSKIKIHWATTNLTVSFTSQSCPQIWFKKRLRIDSSLEHGNLGTYHWGQILSKACALPFLTINNQSPVLVWME